MRLETERNILYFMACTAFPVIIYGSITAYIDGIYSLIVMLLIVIISPIIFIFVIVYIYKHYKKKINHRRATRFHRPR